MPQNLPCLAEYFQCKAVAYHSLGVRESSILCVRLFEVFRFSAWHQ